MVRIYTDMVADLFHAGHVEFLKQARELGDFLLVGIHSEEDVATYKNKPILSLSERSTVIGACKFVDEIIVNSPLIVDRAFIEKHNIDIVVHAHPIIEIEKYARFYAYPISQNKFIRLEYNEGISTTEIIRRVIDRKND